MPVKTGGADYDARIKRAEYLSSPHSAATEFLGFYKHVVAFQKLLGVNIAAAHEVKPGSVPASVLRGEIDFTLILPYFRGYLSLLRAERAEEEAVSAVALRSQYA